MVPATPQPVPASSGSARLWLRAGAAALWLTLVVVGLAQLWSYGAASAQPAQAPTHWPDACDIERDPSKPTLLVFAHPHCPCTRATISELDRIAARCHGEVSIVVLFILPPAMDDEWAKGERWRAAAAIPNVVVRLDREGADATRFGARTSGQTLLYDRRGELVFAGGVTASRGHAGDNPGATAVIAFARDGRAPRSSTPVFGCELL